MQPWNSNHPSTNIRNLASNQETAAHTEEKRSRRICRYDRGLEFEASLETRVHASCPWDSALNLQTGLKVLSLRTEQNSNAVTCKVCGDFTCKFDNNFFDILIIQRSWVVEFFPFESKVFIENR